MKVRYVGKLYPQNYTYRAPENVFSGEHYKNTEYKESFS